jgi:uncharacterized DUF497 family protein
LNLRSWNGLKLEFEWDERKDKANQIKHGVSFEEAATVFDDPLSLNFDNPEHSRGEERYIILGLSNQSRLLFVSHTDRNNKIRLISARLLTPKERRFYER